jgi:hypothetical protein
MAISSDSVTYPLSGLFRFGRTFAEVAEEDLKQLLKPFARPMARPPAGHHPTRSARDPWSARLEPAVTG